MDTMCLECGEATTTFDNETAVIYSQLTDLHGVAVIISCSVHFSFFWVHTVTEKITFCAENLAFRLVRQTASEPLYKNGLLKKFTNKENQVRLVFYKVLLDYYFVINKTIISSLIGIRVIYNEQCTNSFYETTLKRHEIKVMWSTQPYMVEVIATCSAFVKSSISHGQCLPADVFRRGHLVGAPNSSYCGRHRGHSHSHWFILTSTHPILYFWRWGQ